MESQPVYFVQHADRVVGRKSFEDEPPNTLFVRSTFPTLQGEGPLAGQYVFFIRTAGCNYGDKDSHCQFCDTDFRMSEGKTYSFDVLRGMIDAEHCRTVVVTGGEPTLQANLVDFIKVNPDLQFQIESNGTQFRVIEQLLDLKNCGVVVSPKFSRDGRTITPSPKMIDKVTFKFLVSAAHDQPERVLPSWYRLLRQPFYLSPIAVYQGQYEGEVVSAWGGNVINRELTAANYAYAAALVFALGRKQLRARLSIQQHIFTNIP